jgi:hypothetical protein
MSDYGCGRQFATFITPQSQPDYRVALGNSPSAAASTSPPSNHRYQPAFLDTWTLLSWVAARTGRLSCRLGGLGVLVWAAASLNLLSKRRIELAMPRACSGSRSKRWAAHGARRPMPSTSSCAIRGDSQRSGVCVAASPTRSSAAGRATDSGLNASTAAGPERRRAWEPNR